MLLHEDAVLVLAGVLATLQDPFALLLDIVRLLDFVLGAQSTVLARRHLDLLGHDPTRRRRRTGPRAGTGRCPGPCPGSWCSSARAAWQRSGEASSFVTAVVCERAESGLGGGGSNRAEVVVEGKGRIRVRVAPLAFHERHLRQARLRL